MSAFTLGQLAAVAGKHPRSMRRWFDSGFFGDAARTTPGGQRRVRGSNAEKVVAEARKRAQGYERRRPTEDEKFRESMAKSARKVNKAMRQLDAQFRKLDRQSLAAANLVGKVTFKLAGMSDDELGDYGLPPEPVEELVWRTAISRESARAVLITSLALWMKSIGSSDPALVAAAIGISRRTLRRRLGQYLPTAKVVADLVADVVEDPGYDHKSKKWQPIDVSGAGTDLEKTTWKSACNYKMNATKPPKIDSSHDDDEGD